ncbi:MAG: hypothetical protein LBQ40_04480 [Clostridiales bacterium]|jgi:hypothetical protein|nr:hypothetical protein [Clostridiales bacterium]
MGVDKNAVMIEYLKQCPKIDRLFFISSEVKDGTQNFVPISNERVIRQYIDGSKLKYYDFAIVEFVGGSVAPLPLTGAENHENVKNYGQLQSLIDWVSAQSKARNFPDFGEYNEVQDIYSVTSNPTLSGRENEKIFRYMIQIRIEYIEGDY